MNSYLRITLLGCMMKNSRVASELSYFIHKNQDETLRYNNILPEPLLIRIIDDINDFLVNNNLI